MMKEHTIKQLIQRQPNFLSQKQEKKSAQSQAAPAHCPLKLKASNGDDLQVISALLQDAVVWGAHFHYDVQDKTFTLLANRFCWEDSPERLNQEKVYGRITSALQFHHIEAVQKSNLHLENTETPYALLRIEETQNKEVHLTFSGTACLKLTLTTLFCTLTDLDEMWYTPLKPNHSWPKDNGAFHP